MTQADQVTPERSDTASRRQNVVPINFLNKKESNVVPASNEQQPQKQGKNYSESLNNFRETLKDVLEEIVSLEVNTIIVKKINPDNFIAEDFYASLIYDLHRFDKYNQYINLKYKTEEELPQAREALLVRSNKLNQLESELAGDPSLLEQYRNETAQYNKDVKAYKEAVQFFSEEVAKDVKNFIETCQASQDKRNLYIELKKQIQLLEICKTCRATKPEGEALSLQEMEMLKNEKLSAPDIRILRKMWDLQQSVLNGDRIYAQTHFHLDGDITNRFIEDLFKPSPSEFSTDMPKLVFDLHNRALENAQKQWGGLITIVVDMVKSLIPFRQDNPPK